MDRVDNLKSSSSSSSSSSGSFLLPSVQCIKGSSTANECNEKLLETGDFVEEITIGNVTLRAPFEKGKYGVQKVLQNSYKGKETSVQVVVRRGSADVAELQTCILPSESVGRKQFVLQAIDDLNHAVEFVDRTESKCSEVQASRKCRSTMSPSIVVKLNSSALDQDIYNLRRECEEKDATIKELSTSIRSLEDFGFKRIGELEDMISRKNMIIRKLKKDMMLLEHKVVNLKNSRHPSFYTAMSNEIERQIPTMTDNLLYYMDSSISPSSSESDSPSENQPDPTAIAQHLSLHENQSYVQETRKLGQDRNSQHQVKQTNGIQKFRTPSHLMEKSLNVTTKEDSGTRRMTTSLFSDSNSRRRDPAKPKNGSTQKRWI